MNFWEGFYSIGEKLCKLIYLNFLWLLFSVVGLFAFGIFPATIALFTVIRQQLLHNRTPITQSFWQAYKTAWLKGNGYAVISYLVLMTLAIDYYALYTIDFLHILLVPTLIISFLIFGTICFIFPVYTHFELSFFTIIKQAFLFTLTSPLTIVWQALCIICLYGVFNIIPGAIPMFSASVLSAIMMKNALRAFDKVAHKKQEEVDQHERITSRASSNY